MGFAVSDRRHPARATRLARPDSASSSPESAAFTPQSTDSEGSLDGDGDGVPADPLLRAGREGADVYELREGAGRRGLERLDGQEACYHDDGEADVLPKEDADDIVYTADEERAIVRKFDRRLVLFVALLYLLSFLDRSSESFPPSVHRLFFAHSFLVVSAPNSPPCSRLLIPFCILPRHLEKVFAWRPSFYAVALSSIFLWGWMMSVGAMDFSGDPSCPNLVAT